jgi:hypothetical protein
MKSRLTLAIVCCGLLTLLNPYIITAQAADFGTNHQPRTCPSKSAPTRGAIGAKQAAIYAACHREDVRLITMNGTVQFVDILSLQVSKPRRANSNDFRSFTNIDTTKPVYDLQGSVIAYTCFTIAEGSIYKRGQNCTITRVPDSRGLCVQDTSGEWSCTISTYLPGLKQERGMPPPN